jgi:hypothetical protein
VPNLNLPEFRGDGCDFLRVSLGVVLNPKELKALQRIIGSFKHETAAHRYRVAGKPPKRVAVREVIRVHTVSPEDAKDESETMRQEDSNSPGPEDIAAHLHFEVIVETGKLVEKSPDEDKENVEDVISWLRSIRKEIDATVFAGRIFSAEAFEPAVVFPDVPKPFTAVRGVTLVRESDEPSPGSVVYEIHVHKKGERIPVLVNFRGKFGSGDDALDKLLQQATEISQFGVRARQTTGEYAAHT